MSLDAHPELPEFDYIRPASLQEASRFLAEHAGEARPLLGGTDIFVRMRDGFWHDRYLVDVKKLDGTDELRFDPLDGLTIGAGVNMNRIMAHAAVQQHYPALAEACRWVATYQLRTRATVVGNICNASPAGDTIGACLLYDGVLQVHGVGGWREVPLAGFFQGPGKTSLQPGDIATSLHLPLPPPGASGVYQKLGRNNWGDLSIVGVTVIGYANPASASGWTFRLALASVAAIPLVVPVVQEYLESTPINLPAIRHAARLAQQACRPIDDVRGSARYRKAMVRTLSEKALKTVWGRINIQAALPEGSN
jgi:carbon-monoxide dehydrogenase medium subunit